MKKRCFMIFMESCLTEHQKLIYEDFVLNDLSLSEIAEDREISRQGVYDIVRRCRKQLQGYEAKLHLVAKFIHTKRTRRRDQSLCERDS